MRVIANGLEAVRTYLERDAIDHSGQPGTTLLAVDDDGRTVLVLAGHLFTPDAGVGRGLGLTVKSGLVVGSDADHRPPPPSLAPEHFRHLLLLALRAYQDEHPQGYPFLADVVGTVERTAGVTINRERAAAAVALLERKGLVNTGLEGTAVWLSPDGRRWLQEHAHSHPHTPGH